MKLSLEQEFWMEMIIKNQFRKPMLTMDLYLDWVFNGKMPKSFEKWKTEKGYK